MQEEPELTPEELDQLQDILEAHLEFYLQAYKGDYQSGTMQQAQPRKYGPGKIKRNGELL